MKRDMEYFNEDINRNWKKLKRRLTFKIVSLFSISIIIPIVMFYILSSSFTSRLMYQGLDKRLEGIRTQKIENIKNYYSNIEKEMMIMSNNIKTKEIQEEYSFLKDSKQRLNINNLYIYDQNYQIIDSISDEKRLPTEDLLKVFFAKEIYISGFKIDGEDIYQYVFFKGFKEKNPFYIVFEITPKSFENLIDLNDYNYDLINEDFYIISSSIKENVNDVEINPVTKKLLDGLMGVETIDGIRYSYSFVDISDSPLYIQIYEDEAEIQKNIWKLKYYSIIILIMSVVIGFLAIWNMRKNTIRYSQSAIRMGIEEEADKKYPYIKEEIISIFNELDNVIDSIDYLKSFNEKIDALKIRIENQNKELKEQIEDRSQIIKRVQEDPKIQEELIKEIIQKEKKNQD